MVHRAFRPGGVRWVIGVMTLVILLPAVASRAQFTPGGGGGAYSPPPMKPDLVISSFAILNFGVSTKTPCAENKPRFDLGACGNPEFLVTVTNQGAAPAGGHTTVQVSFNGEWTTTVPLRLASLYPGGSVEVTVATRLGECGRPCAGHASPYRFGARVDGADLIDESDEANNRWRGVELIGCQHCP